MKTIQVTKEIYENQLQNSDFCDDDCDCFGIEISGKLYLYNKTFVENWMEEEEDEYYLTIFDNLLIDLLCNDKFVAKLATEMIEHKPDNFCDFCKFIAECNKGNYDDSKRPFQLYDIIYSL